MDCESPAAAVCSQPARFSFYSISLLPKYSPAEPAVIASHMGWAHLLPHHATFELFQNSPTRLLFHFISQPRKHSPTESSCHRIPLKIGHFAVTQLPRRLTAHPPDCHFISSHNSVITHLQSHLSSHPTREWALLLPRCLTLTAHSL